MVCLASLTLEDEGPSLLPGPQLKRQPLPVRRHLVERTLDASLPGKVMGSAVRKETVSGSSTAWWDSGML